MIALHFSQDCVLHQPHRVRGVSPQVQGGHGQGAALLWDRREAASQRHQDCGNREMLEAKMELSRPAYCIHRFVNLKVYLLFMLHDILRLPPSCSSIFIGIFCV